MSDQWIVRCGRLRHRCYWNVTIGAVEFLVNATSFDSQKRAQEYADWANTMRATVGQLKQTWKAVKL